MLLKDYSKAIKVSKMQLKISAKRCPECQGMLTHSMGKVECIQCGYTVLKNNKGKKQTEVK